MNGGNLGLGGGEFYDQQVIFKQKKMKLLLVTIFIMR